MLTDLFLLTEALLAALWCVLVGALAFGLTRLKQGEDETAPTLSIIVAARNEEACIERCVRALLQQDYKVALTEIVVVDDNSTDRTAEIVRKAAEGIERLKLIQAPPLRPGVSPKKNAILTGIAASSGDVILTTDADCVPKPSWVAGMARMFDPGVVAVVGYSPLRVHKASTERVSGVARFDAIINGVISAGSVGLEVPTTAVGRNFAYRRKAFEDAGGFGESLAGASGDDDLLLQRLSRSGGLIRFALDPVTFVPAEGAESFGRWLRMKRRHLSAGAKYGGGMVALFGLLYIFHLGLIALAGLTIAGSVSFWWLILIWGAKISFDYRTLRWGAAMLFEDDWQGSWFVAEIFSPFLVAILAPLALVGKVKWKERELRR